METARQKQAVRRRFLEWRRGLAPSEIEAAGRRIARFVQEGLPYVRARDVLVYLSTGDEVPTRPLLEAARRAGKRVFLPAPPEPVFRLWQGEELGRGPWGIPVPRGSGVFHPDGEEVVALVPVVAWTRAGARLGRGGGWYDRALRSLGSSVLRVGLAYAGQEARFLPEEPTDERLHYVVTERGWVACGPTGGGTARRAEGGEA
ncbi:MAG: 5-formyltetrahydrofolate cyclo-ligase [Candidatus Binatia bacterium]|nr:MAG: 5-formyltetrahydrofolate cyclo-ligase [Candidatus Binatia bacterium]